MAASTRDTRYRSRREHNSRNIDARRWETGNDNGEDTRARWEGSGARLDSRNERTRSRVYKSGREMPAAYFIRALRAARC